MQGYVCIFMCDQLGGSVSGVSDLSVFIWFQFDIMNSVIYWDVVQRYVVVCFDWCIDIGDQLVICSNVFGGDDVVMFVVCIFQQSDVCSVVWIVFDVFNDGRDVIFVVMEVDQMVVLFVIIIDMMGGDMIVVVMVVRFGFFFQQWCVGSVFVQFLIYYFDDKVMISGSWFVFNDCYDVFFYLVLVVKLRFWFGWRVMYVFFQLLCLFRL